MKILVVEDDKKVARLIAHGFKQERHAVDTAFDGKRGEELAAGIDYDVVILDLTLPKLSGLELLARLKEKRPALPVLLLTAEGGLQEKIKGLDRGADDCMVKPFAFAELSARVRALLRRGKGGDGPQLRLADLVLDASTHTVTRAGRKLDLSPKETALLEFLLRNAGRPVTRTMIIEHVWDIHFDCATNVVDVYIKYLRDKIDSGFSPPLIHTVRGVGYMASDEES